MKKVEIKLNGMSCWFNDVDGYCKIVSYCGSQLLVFYNGDDVINYSFESFGDIIVFRKFYYEDYKAIDPIYCDVREEEAQKFISII